MNFQRGVDAKRQMNIGKTVFDYLAEHPVCKPMNDLFDGSNSGVDKRDPNIKVWINPNNQFSFNSCWCSVEDLWDWMDGKGVMVKGDTPEEKKKYWDYAVAEVNDENQVMWMIRHYYPWFDKMTTDFKPHEHQGYERGQIANPIKIKARVKDCEENTKRQEDVIIKMLAPFVEEMRKDLEWGRDWRQTRKEFRDGYYGIKRTLYCLGIGYMGACNTPEEICNLAWVNDVVEAKAYYLFLKGKEEKGEITLPDFKWLSER